MTPNLSDNLGQTTIYLRVNIAVQPILSRMTALPPPHEKRNQVLSLNQNMATVSSLFESHDDNDKAPEPTVRQLPAMSCFSNFELSLRFG